MTAKDAISPLAPRGEEKLMKTVGADMPLVDVLPRLLDAPGRRLAVEEGDRCVLGVIDESSLLEGLARMIAPRDDSSVITVECAPSDYSASHLAHAVEDSDAHLVDLWSVPSDDGRIRVTLRVRNTDPTSAVHNLERYGYSVVEAHGEATAERLVSDERLMALRALLSV